MNDFDLSGFKSCVRGQFPFRLQVTLCLRETLGKKFALRGLILAMMNDLFPSVH